MKKDKEFKYIVTRIIYYGINIYLIFLILGLAQNITNPLFWKYSKDNLFERHPAKFEVYGWNGYDEILSDSLRQELYKGEGYYLTSVSLNGFIETKSENGTINYLYIGFRLVVLVIMIIIFWLFSQILRSTIKKRPFISENSKKLRIAGILAFFVAVLRFVIERYSNYNSPFDINFNGVLYSVPVEIPFLEFGFTTGLVFLVFSEFLRVGIKMQLEQDLTV